MAEKTKDTVKEEEPKEDGLGLMLQPKGVMPDRSVVICHLTARHCLYMYLSWPVSEVHM